MLTRHPCVRQAWASGRATSLPVGLSLCVLCMLSGSAACWQQMQHPDRAGALCCCRLRWFHAVQPDTIAVSA